MQAKDKKAGDIMTCVRTRNFNASNIWRENARVIFVQYRIQYRFNSGQRSPSWVVAGQYTGTGCLEVEIRDNLKSTCSANSVQNSKILKGVNQEPGGS
jgi:hypothetical protein